METLNPDQKSFFSVQINAVSIIIQERVRKNSHVLEINYSFLFLLQIKRTKIIIFTFYRTLKTLTEIYVFSYYQYHLSVIYLVSIFYYISCN